MKASLLAVRAIGSEFARNLWSGVFVVVLVISVGLVALLVWLTSLSSWWWLLAIPFGVFMSVAAVLLIVFRMLIKYVRPEQTAQQKQLVAAFAEKLQFTSEITSTPKFIMLFRVVRSIAAPKSEPYLQRLLETKNLKKDFQEVARSFTSD